jgi:hypothetical protein
MAKLAIGDFAIGGDWVEPAGDGLVVLEGRAGCAGFTESVLVERGSSQRTAVPVLSRCGQARYWNGSGYTTLSINNDAVAPVQTGTVSWSNGTYSITGSAVIDGSAANFVPVGADPYCAEQSCSVRAQTGSININASYRVTGPGFDYMIHTITTVEGPNASVVYQEAPSVADP